MNLVRGARLVAVAAIFSGLVATTSVDVVVGDHRRAHDRKVAAIRAEQLRERSYLSGLAATARDVETTINSVNLVVAASEAPDPAALVGARDAFAHGGALRVLDAAATKLAPSNAPAPMRATVADLGQALAKIRASVRSLGSHGTTTDVLALANALSADSTVSLTVASTTFTEDLNRLYARQHETAPGTSGATARTHGDWIYDADTACVNANLALLSVPTSFNSLDDFGRYARTWRAALQTLSKRLKSARRPSGFPAAIAARLGVLDYHVSLFDQQLNAVRRHDAAALGIAIAKLRPATPALTRLSHSLRDYGVVGCANIMDGWAGVSTAKSHRVTSVV